MLALTFWQAGLVLGDSSFTTFDTTGFGLLLLKVMFVLAGLLYLVFGVIVTRQVHVMKNTLITSFSPVIQLLGYLHLVVAIVVFIFFLSL